MRIPTLGVHIIVKDEAELLPQCLDSIQGADEIIVVDTGSNDDSVAIAMRQGAKVISAPWQDSFAAARNEAIRYAATDWILCLDADEHLVSSIRELREHLRHTAAEALAVLIDNALGPRLEDRLTHRAVRIFRNGRGFYFRGAVHEDIGQSVVDRFGAAAIHDSPIRICHYGYLPQIMERKQKTKRNEALLIKALKEQPNDPFYLYNMGVTCCQAGRLAEAKELLSKALFFVADRAPYRPTLIRDLAKIMLELQEAGLAELLLRKELRSYPDYSELAYLLGLSLEHQGRWESALEAFRSAAAQTSGNDGYVAEAGTGSYRALAKAAEMGLKLGRWEEAAREYNRALQSHSHYAPALRGAAEAFQLLNVPLPEIASFLRSAVQPLDVRQHAALASVLYEIGAFREAKDSIPAELLSDPELRILYTKALLQCGLYAHAERMWSEYPPPAGANEAQQLILLCGIGQLERDGSLRGQFLDAIPSPLRESMAELRDFATIAAKDEAAANRDTPSSSTAELAQELIVLAVQVQCWNAARTLLRLDPGWELVYAKELYRLGRTPQAADLFLELLRQRRIDDEGVFMLGEILYDKGHYSQAAEMFESSLATSPEDARARTGAALSYFRLAAAGLKDMLSRQPDCLMLENDVKLIEQHVEMLNRTGWHTEWNGFRRRVRREAAGDFAVHDRQE
ncbi:hypothetical protein SD70_15510 [Gordoniibacillus kamchatkensis]|uniref:Glycosyltransferase 2-like domain-containing protein n=1 Tax=Gordoniibacillus kamchatkensis TaxID=1590651 RepID=A0ABR5AGM8_9BACL|nr:glycosyltransferase [Paenibacillus sp. VKM B-2647]KIL40215.1 hypothetical protein SD70_15510 [Paenibacillus sp. VKM B-2647]